jgi:O-antigen/teichoic acid export membrane protein
MSASDAAARTTGATVVRGGAWTALSHVVPQLYVFALTIAAARFLSPPEYGRQSFISFIAISVLLVLTSGMALALMRSVAEAVGAGRTGDALAIVAWAWRVQAVAAVAGGAALVVAALLGADPQAAWILAGAFVTLGTLQSVANAVLLGVQRFRTAAVIGLATGAVMVPVAIGVLAAGSGMVGIFAVEAAVAAVNLAFSAVLARRALGAPTGRISAEVRRSTLRFVGLTTANAGVTLVVWRRSEFVFLAHYSTDVEIALYSIAFATVAAIAAVPERLAEVLVSAFATLRGADATERIRTGFSRSLRLLVMATLPLTAGLAAVGPELLRLVYGDEYREAGDVLLAVVAVVPFLAVAAISTALLAGLGDARTPLVAGVFAAVVNIALAFVLVPRYDALGAGFANTGAQVAATIALYLAARRVSGTVDWRPGSLARVAVAAGGCALASVGTLSVLAGPGGLILAIAAGAIVFTALALGLRALSADDAAWLGDVLGGRAGALVRRAGAR